MTSPRPFDQGAGYPAASWYVPSPTCNRSYLVAALRAAAIAFVLLAILVLVVIF